MFTNDFILEDFRIASGQFPRMEKRCPINVGNELFKWVIVKNSCAQKVRFGGLVVFPINVNAICDGIVVSEKNFLL